jgi:class 3 adenylate cyclase
VQPPRAWRPPRPKRGHTVLLLRIDGLSEHDLERAKRLVKEFTEERGGRIAAPSGRTLASVFLRPADGVAAALLLQEALTALTRETKTQTSIRASLHLGEVVLEEEPGAPPGISGNALRTAVCLVNAARPGQVLLSAATMGLARDGLVEDDELSPRVRWKSYGAWKLAEDAEPLEIGEACRALRCARP